MEIKDCMSCVKQHSADKFGKVNVNAIPKATIWQRERERLHYTIQEVKEQNTK